MSEGAGLIFLGVLGISFMAVGVLGIYKKIKRSKSIQGMQKLPGVLVEYNVAQKRDEDDLMVDMFYPVYEYERGGERKRLYSTVGVCGYKCHTMGKRVHILIDSQTEKVTCMEDERSYEFILLIFGVIGVFALVLMWMLATGSLH